ncbi:Hypothetical protein CINCED_3A019216, partial [Cinara cedri]
MDDIPYIDDDGAINDFNCIPGDMNYGSKNDYDVEIPVKTGVDMEKKPSHEQLKLQGERSDEIIKCDIVINSEHVDEYPRAVELYLNNSFLFMLNCHKQLLKFKNTVAKTMAGIVLISIIWWLVYLYYMILNNKSTDTVVGRVTKLTVYLPPLMGMILAGFLYSICLEYITEEYTGIQTMNFDAFVFII